MTSAEGLRVASLVAILALAQFDLLTLPLLALLGALGAAGTVTYSVTAPSLVPALVPREALAAANGRMELARSAAFAAGPALGGVLVGGHGPRDRVRCGGRACRCRYGDARQASRAGSIGTAAPPSPARPARRRASSCSGTLCSGPSC